MAQNEQMTEREKLAKYEELLQEILDKAVKKEGIVLAGPDNGFYKIRIGNEEFICKSPKFTCKKNDSVITVDGVIIERTPEALVTVQEDEVEFTHIEWSAVGGMKSQIESIRKKVEYPTKYKKYYEEFNLPLPKGILLHGPTGCGKTLIARAIASSMFSTKKINKNSFIYLKGGELLSKYVGESENRIKNAFESARASFKKTGVRPIIFIDEAEAIVPQRGSRVSSDVDATIVPTFLSEMDGFDDEHNPFVLLATNYEDRIDSAILRPGRIDLKVYIGRPTLEDAADIFKIHLSKTKVSGDIDKLSKEAAKLMFSSDTLREDASGALIENLVITSVENALTRRIGGGTVQGVTKEDIVKAINSK